jgi:hypothetical protein
LEGLVVKRFALFCLFCLAVTAVSGCVIERRSDGGLTIRPIHIGVY